MFKNTKFGEVDIRTNRDPVVDCQLKQSDKTFKFSIFPLKIFESKREKKQRREGVSSYNSNPTTMTTFRKSGFKKQYISFLLELVLEKGSYIVLGSFVEKKTAEEFL